MIKNIFLYGSIAGILAFIVIVYSLTVKLDTVKAERATMEDHYKTQIEVLKHPKEKIDENKEVIKIVYKDKKGDDVIVERIITNTVIEKEPVILGSPRTNTIRRWYISGTYGSTFSEDRRSGYGVGAGYYIMDGFSIGVRYDRIQQDVRYGIETTIRF